MIKWICALEVLILVGCTGRRDLAQWTIEDRLDAGDADGGSTGARATDVDNGGASASATDADGGSAGASATDPDCVATNDFPIGTPAANSAASSVEEQANADIANAIDQSPDYQRVCTSLWDKSAPARELSLGDSPTQEQRLQLSVALIQYNTWKAYCPDTLITHVSCNDCYCYELKGKAPFACRNAALPLLECTASLKTADPATECAQAWLGASCDFSRLPYEPVAVPSGGWSYVCHGSGVTFGGGDASFSPFVCAGSSVTPCSNGHTYLTRCSLSPDCSVSCECRLDRKTSKTVILTGIDWNDSFFSSYARTVCGWPL